MDKPAMSGSPDVPEAPRDQAAPVRADGRAAPAELPPAGGARLARSSRLAAARDSGTVRGARARAIRPTGTLSAARRAEPGKGRCF